MDILDMRGQPCPVPVVHAKKSLAEQGAKGVVVLVDNVPATQNLEKMARGTGCAFSCEADGASSYRVRIVKGADADPHAGALLEPGQGAQGSARGPVVLISSDSMGTGSRDLGQILIKGFIFSLTQLAPPPEAAIFLNSGALLTAEGANTVDDLKKLEEKGTKICTCGTCANYYKTLETLAVGSIIDMMAVANHLAKASSIVSL